MRSEEGEHGRLSETRAVTGGRDQAGVDLQTIPNFGQKRYRKHQTSAPDFTLARPVLVHHRSRLLRQVLRLILERPIKFRKIFERLVQLREIALERLVQLRE